MMRKLIAVLTLILVAGIVIAKPVIEKKLKKIDDKTLEVTTTTTDVTVVNFDKAVLQTELDHIPDRRAELQEKMDALDEREAELIKMLEVFK